MYYISDIEKPKRLTGYPRYAKNLRPREWNSKGKEREWKRKEKRRHSKTII